MIGAEPRALHQGFLPSGGAQRAYVWKYSHAIGGRRPRHFHVEPELNLVVRGSATFGVGDAITHVASGELVAFPPGQDHALLEASPDLYLYAIGLDPAYSADVLGPERYCVLTPLHVRLEPSELAPVIERAAAIVDRSGVDQLGAELWQRAHWLGRRATARSDRAMHVLTRRALELVSAAPELGLERLSQKLRAHPSEISRHFHRDVGMTLARYRMRLRLLRFIGLFDAGAQNLAASAAAAGFGSYSQCHRTFQSELGCAPRSFLCSGVRERMQLAYSGLR